MIDKSDVESLRFVSIREVCVIVSFSALTTVDASLICDGVDPTWLSADRPVLSRVESDILLLSLQSKQVLLFIYLDPTFETISSNYY